MYSCPHCHKMVKDLKGHIARKHPDTTSSSKKDPNSPKSTTTSSNGEKFEIKKPLPKKEEKEVSKYHCSSCRGDLSRGQNPCPHCGIKLNWSDL